MTSSAFRMERDGDLAVLWFDLPGEKVNKFSSAVMQEFAGNSDYVVGPVTGRPGSGEAFCSNMPIACQPAPISCARKAGLPTEVPK